MPATDNPNTPIKPGLHKLSLNGLRYSLSIPPKYSAQESVPLILALHYAGHGFPHYGLPMITELVGQAFEKLGAMILAPDCTAEDWTQPQSEEDLLTLLDHLENAYNIDPTKRLVTGYSMGGIGTWHWAANHPQRFGAAIVMAGLPPQKYLEINWKIPLYVLHSRQDELMPIQASQQAVEQLQRKGVDISMRALDNITHFEVYRYTPALRELVPWVQQKWGC